MMADVPLESRMPPPLRRIIPLLFLGLLSSSNVCWAHVALTYPPARKYDLDFLDNIRTPGPCGMPEGTKKTALLAGSTINVTWHLGYPHKGGYKLELLNDQGKPWMDLTPVSEHNEYVQTDPTAQSHSIRLPRDLSCKGCTIRLKREALEWTNNYTFWSCADVDVVQAVDYKEDCSGNGDLKNGVCVCNKLYSGARCQYKDECWLDKDCGAHGKCVDIDATTYPKKQCYCQMGWFGKDCDKESPYKSVEDMDLSAHHKKELSPEFTLYWKILKVSDEIEIAMKVKSTTYVSLGWRPKGKTAACKAFPPIDVVVLEEGDEYGIAEPVAELAAINGAPKEEPQSEPVHKHPVGQSERPIGSPLPNFTGPLRGNATEVQLDIASEPEPIAEETSAKTSKPKPQNAGSDSAEGRRFGSGGATATTSPPPPTRKTSYASLADAMELAPEETITHAVAESNGHSITLEVTAPPLDVNARPSADEAEADHQLAGDQHPSDIRGSAAGSESANDGEVNYGFDNADDSLSDYSGSAHKTSTARNARPKRQATSGSSPSKNGTTTTTATTTASAARTTSAATSKTKRTSEPPGATEEPVAETSAEPVAEPKAKAEPEANPTAKPVAEPKPEPAAEPKPEPVAEPKPEPAAEPTSEPVAEPTSEPTGKLPEVKPTDEPDASDSKVATSQTPSNRNPKSRKDQHVPHPEPNAEPEPEPNAEPEPHAEPAPNGVQAEPVSSGSASYPRAYPKGAYTPKADFHAMDCTDIVTGMAQGTYSRVIDMYTRDRSTPRKDAFYGGSDSLTAAGGFEKNDTTTIIFRRKLQSDEDTDHSFQKSPMHVIWARGQETGAYVHSPASGLDGGKASIPDFYRRDEFKYHGHKNQRGVSSIDFFNDSKQPHTSHSRGEFKIPNACTGFDCEYRATWEYNAINDSILFTVTSNNSDKWTGIGFSEDNKMPNSDAILGWVNDLGRPFIMDTWIDKYEPPKLDENQDVNFIKGTKINGQVTLVFSRKRDTGDLRDLAFTDTSCLYMFYPFDGGVYNAVNKKIRTHASTPAVSDTKICIDRSGSGSSASTPEWSDSPELGTAEPELGLSPVWPQPDTTAIPPKALVNYNVAIRLPNQTLDDAVERGSDLKMLIRERLKFYVTDTLKKIDGFEKVEVTGLESEKNESHVVANMKVYFDPSKTLQRSSRKESSIMDEMKNILNATVVQGKVGRLLVDPSYLIVNQPEATNNIADADITQDETIILAKNDETLLYVIIAAAIALGVLLLIQIICMCYRWRNARKSRVSKERLISGAGWKDYTAPGGAGNYGYEHFGASNDETPKIGKHQASNSGNGTSRSTGTHASNNGSSRGGGGGNSHGPGPTVDLHPGETRSLNRNPRDVVNGAGGVSNGDRPHYSRRSESLPRPNMSTAPVYGPRGGGSQLSSGGGATSLNPQGGLQPDFYFMPSQRRYSGEVVRVYVDYNNPNYTGK